MTKTPEQMAMDYIKDVETARNPSIATTAFPQLQRCFLAGYQAAKEHAHAALEEAEAEIDRLQTKLSDAGILTTEHLIDASKMVSSSETLNNWISVKERLPEHFEDVLTFEDGECYRVNSISQLTKYWWDSDEGFERHPSHWMPLPKPPKGEK